MIRILVGSIFLLIGSSWIILNFLVYGSSRFSEGPGVSILVIPGVYLFLSGSTLLVNRSPFRWANYFFSILYVIFVLFQSTTNSRNLVFLILPIISFFLLKGSGESPQNTDVSLE